MSGSRRVAALDCRGAAIRRLSALAALTLWTAATPGAAPGDFEQLRWNAPGSELAILSEQPAVCLRPRAVDGSMDDAAGRVQSGAALFTAPALLGGQAAKAGLSCASCHINGRTNPHFFLTGVSAAPGTADVSHSFFSAARGNGRFDPVAIPDLAAPGKIARDPDTRQLEPFLRNLIVEEFGGAEPGTATIDALAAYVRAITPCAAGKDTPLPRTLGDQLRLIDGGTAAALAMISRRDDRATRLAIAAVRHQLGLIAERYAGGRFAAERAALLAASRRLQAIGDDGDRAAVAAAVQRWKADFDTGLVPRLRRGERRSLYNRDRLARALR